MEKKKFERICKIILAAYTAIALIIAVFALSNINKPKYNCSDPTHTYIEYKGKKYHDIGYASLYEYETDKCLKRAVSYTINTIKNDENTNFLTFNQLQNHKMYTCIDDFEEKYFSDTYKAYRVTAVKLCNSYYGDFFTQDESFNDIILNADKYSDGITATYPLKESNGFTCDIFVFEDNLPIGYCNLGQLAYYDGKWVFKAYDIMYEGTANANVDTRTFTGIEINNPKAVEILNEYSSKYFSYITK